MHVDSRLHCYDSAISSWLGGQHGQEKEEISGEEDSQEDEAEIREEKEVRPTDLSTSKNVEDCVKRAGDVSMR
ncbi:MAG: hypothetical protein WEC82_06455 [Xanthobacteraceae bacterium]